MSSIRAGMCCALAVATASCARKPVAAQCPDPATVAPASVGGAAEVRSLAGTLSGPDRENSIAEGAHELHRRDPMLGSDQITDILIAADCEGQRSNTGSTYDRRQRTKIISKQVEAVMTVLPHSAT